MFIIRQLYQTSWEFDKEIHTLFVDFKKAYDSIHRESLLNIMKEFHFPQKLVNLVSISVMETSIRVKIGNSITEPATVNSGLRQGDSLSPILFNVVLEKVIREMKIGPNNGIRLQNTSIGILAYADDIVLMEESQDSLKSLFSKLHKAASKVGLCVNEGKTEYMFLSRRELPFCQSIKIDHFEFKRVEQFKYLGSFLTEKNNVTNEIAARIQAGNRCYYGLTKILSSRTISRRMKERLYTSLIRPVVLYGSETWPIRKMDEHKFMVFERKVLRKIYGPVKDEITVEWRRRKNIELEILYGNADIVEVIRSRRLRWAGHAWRSQNPLLHAVMEQNPIGKRPLGRPRMRWEDVVKKDVERLGGCSNWRMLALDREVWKLGYRHKADYILEQRAWDRFKSKDSSLKKKAVAWGVTTTMKEKRKIGGGCGFKTAIKAAKNTMKKNIGEKNLTKLTKKCVAVARKTFNIKKTKVPRTITIPKKGGVLPLIPIFVGLSALGALTGCVANVVKVANDFNRNAPSHLGKGLYLTPYKGNILIIDHGHISGNGKPYASKILESPTWLEICKIANDLIITTGTYFFKYLNDICVVQDLENIKICCLGMGVLSYVNKKIEIESPCYYNLDEKLKKYLGFQNRTFDFSLDINTSTMYVPNSNEKYINIEKQCEFRLGRNGQIPLASIGLCFDEYLSNCLGFDYIGNFKKLIPINKTWPRGKEIVLGVRLG
ncbi:hypothetical protein QTP88_015504 [Uroleucon formosanum]